MMQKIEFKVKYLCDITALPLTWKSNFQNMIKNQRSIFDKYLFKISHNIEENYVILTFNIILSEIKMSYL
jgi:hypothetical protein